MKSSPQVSLYDSIIHLQELTLVSLPIEGALTLYRYSRATGHQKGIGSVSDYSIKPLGRKIYGKADYRAYSQEVSFYNELCAPD